MRMLVLGASDSGYCREIQQAAWQRDVVCDIVSLQDLICHLRGRRMTFQARPLAVSSAASHSAPSARSHFASSSSPAEQPALLSLTEYAACVIRTMPAGSLEQVVYRMDALAALEAAGVRMVNPPKAMECAVDKYLSLFRCQQAGLPIPETFCCESADQALEQFGAWGNEAVVKPLFGAEGRGILHLTDRETARRVFRAWEQIGAVLYLQRYIPCNQSDVRVLMLAGEPLGAIRRTGTTDFRANCAQSGIAAPHQLTAAETELARAACEATGVLFGGVDLIYDAAGKLYLLEVNGSPGWQAFRRVTGIDVPGKLLDWLLLTGYY